MTTGIVRLQHLPHFLRPRMRAHHFLIRVYFVLHREVQPVVFRFQMVLQREQRIVRKAMFKCIFNKSYQYAWKNVTVGYLPFVSKIHKYFRAQALLQFNEILKIHDLLFQRHRIVQVCDLDLFILTVSDCKKNRNKINKLVPF
jgi:hypothetical protein